MLPSESISHFVMQFCLVTFLCGEKGENLPAFKLNILKLFHLTCILGYFLFLAQFLCPPCTFLWKIHPWPYHMTCTELPPLSSGNLCKLQHRIPSRSLQDKPDKWIRFCHITVFQGKSSTSLFLPGQSSVHRFSQRLSRTPLPWHPWRQQAHRLRHQHSAPLSAGCLSHALVVWEIMTRTTLGWPRWAVPPE